MLELPERLSFSEILHVLMDQITENNLISRKLVQGLDTLRIALGKKLISVKELFEKNSRYIFSHLPYRKKQPGRGKSPAGNGKSRLFSFFYVKNLYW